jgi:hypothetical protein
VSVTPPKPKDTLAIAAARLSKAAPNTWPDFVAALEAYAREAELACVRAPADGVLIAQGKARERHDLLTLLTDAAKQK